MYLATVGSDTLPVGSRKVCPFGLGSALDGGDIGTSPSVRFRFATHPHEPYYQQMASIEDVNSIGVLPSNLSIPSTVTSED